MKRSVASLAVVAVLGLSVLWILVPRLELSQPLGLTVTRRQARAIADREAAAVGIPLERTFAAVLGADSPVLRQALESSPEAYRKALLDPVLGPRLSGYRVIYFRKGSDKFHPAGEVLVSGTGQVTLAERHPRPEDAGAKPTEAELRPRADAFAASRAFPGSPSPVFDSAKADPLRSRTDHVFRYRVRSASDPAGIGLFLEVRFSGNELMGWGGVAEALDGSTPKNDSGGDLVAQLFRYLGIYLVLGILLVRFLRKYHAGEVGVGTAGFLLGVGLLLSLAFAVPLHSLMASSVGLGSVDGFWTGVMALAFKLLFWDIPCCLLLFAGWAVGESLARERWGEKLASFDAVLRRDLVNATVGRSLLCGVLAAPGVVASTLLLGMVPVLLGWARVPCGGRSSVMSLVGGPLAALPSAALEGLVLSVVLLFNLAAFSKGRRLPVGFALALLTGLALTDLRPPIEPIWAELAFGVGGLAAAAALFLATDLLATAVALLGSSLLLQLAPYAAAVTGEPRRDALVVLGIPLAVLSALALAGLATRRAVAYAHEDMAPHVKRIVERERVKAEIDAANRIQAALLPARDPELLGAGVASHYRAATEIGGDYFDFLPVGQRQLAVVLGDVAGHGLTSGIVMAMTKSALLVQIGHDARPVPVLSTLNDIVIRTAPKRMMMTFFYGVLDAETFEMRYASAGHLDPYVYRARERRLSALSSWGFPLGVARREPFREEAVRFETGDRLVLYSDGLIEALDDDGEPFGFDRFEKVILENGQENAGAMKQALLLAIRKFTRNRPLEDDQTLVVLSFDRIALPAAGPAKPAVAT